MDQHKGCAQGDCEKRKELRELDIMDSTKEYDLTYLSFGGGVQSTALLLMSGTGEHGIPKPNVAIFADTQGEIGATYEHIKKMQTWGTDHGIPLIVTTKGSLEQDVLVGVGASQVSIPAFIKTPTGRGVMRRQCTYDYKLLAIQAEVRRQLGLAKGGIAKGRFSVRAMIGISFDEVIRMKPSREEWVTNSYPLVDARLTRTDCKRIIERHGLQVPPRSACYFCPYHRDDYWRWLKRDHPVEFSRAIEFDRKIRTSQPKLNGAAFLHDSLVPLEEIEFDKPDPQLKLAGEFGAECEGMCGV